MPSSARGKISISAPPAALLNSALTLRDICSRNWQLRITAAPLVQLGGPPPLVHSAASAGAAPHSVQNPIAQVTAQLPTHSSRTTSQSAAYVCPMDPEVRANEPGPCPKCGMALEPEIPTAPATRVEYTCPMHPEIVRSEPGTCPVCGMALEPRI